jgi:tripartite-type tricarboxylate transporter receptor subunit TctC
MKKFALAVLSMTLLGSCNIALGQNPAPGTAYPAKPVRLIIGFAASSGPDILGRVIAQNMAEGLSQQVIVENRTGAGGTLATEAASHAPADGYTLLLGTTSTLSIAPGVYPKLAYDPERSFVAIGGVATAPFFIVVHPSTNVNTVQQLIDLGRAKPGQLSFASPGNATPHHIAGEMFKTATGVDMVHVPYKDMGVATTDFLAGRFQVMIQQLSPLERHIKAGKLRAVAIGASSRSPLLPSVPTAAEVGVQGMELLSWYGLFAPQGTPAEAVRRVNGELRKVLEKKDVIERLAVLGFDAAGGTPEQFRTFISQQNALWLRAVKVSGAKID